ncbi:type II toxin-antitoxin system VapC family toxin [Palaeococcus ferrophilus]|uniref:type II toxin-antitoxin system VapC family toxin n=1 Tax=Palaeococcus ferrophilus TaxID=83868 RepID=UPI00064F6998|nr:type II toxin-antitoxin system VapC family toxin [Palaeococcus ferrophilus]
MIDTSVLIEIYRERKLEEHAGSVISVITLFEFIRGIRSERKRVAVLRGLESIFRVEHLDDLTLLMASKIYRELKRRGTPIEDADLLIGATAIAKGYKVWTKNKRHFKRLEEFGLKFWR